MASLSEVAPAETYYFHKKYDLVDADLPARLHQVSFRQLVKIAATSRASAMEIWEPLWVRELFHHVAVTFAWKLARIGGRRREVFSYAMENNDVAMLISGTSRTPRAITRLFSFVVGTYMRVVYTRIAYASGGSKVIYDSLPFVAAIENCTIPNLPSRPENLSAEPRLPGSVVYLARMEDRKGIVDLMKAWPTVEASVDNALLTLIGGGPRSVDVEEWCKERPETRRFLGALSHPDAMKEMSRATVAVLPSIREGRWREQIGLPIHEGILAGATVVTTDETGLADWLTEHGHRVVPARSLTKDLGPEIIQALKNPIDPSTVIAALPEIEGRITANHWMNQFERHVQGETP